MDSSGIFPALVAQTRYFQIIWWMFITEINMNFPKIFTLTPSLLLSPLPPFQKLLNRVWMWSSIGFTYWDSCVCYRKQNWWRIQHSCFLRRQERGCYSYDSWPWFHWRMFWSRIHNSPTLPSFRGLYYKNSIKDRFIPFDVETRGRRALKVTWVVSV